MRHLLSWLTGLFLACVVVVGCRGGSNEMPVTVTGITPAAAPAGSTVAFGATVTGGTPPYTYAWTFTDIGTPSTSTSATPSVLITGDVGTEAVSLVVTDSLSEVGFGSLPFDITDDGVTAVAPSEAGLPLGTAIFEATITGTPDSLAWDFGDGAEPSTSTNLEPEVTLQNPGIYAGTVTATFGGVTMPAFPFDYTVAEPVAPTWRIMRLGDASTQFGWINLIEHQERLTAIYVNNGQLICSRAKVVDPQTDLDWDSHIIGPGMIAAHHNVISIDGRLAMLYLTEAGFEGSALRFAISNTEIPTSASDWTTYALGPNFFATPIFGFTLANIDDERIIIAVPQFSDGSGMRIAVSDGPAPTTPGEWGNTYLLNKEAGGFTWPVFAVRGEDLLLAIQESTGGIGVSVARLLQTSERAPSASEDWTLLSWVPSSWFGSSEAAHDLKLIADKPWIIIGVPERPVEFWFSSEAVPVLPTAWTNSYPGSFVRSPALPVAIPGVANRAVVATPNTADASLQILRQVGTDPMVPSHWAHNSVLSYGMSGGITGICSAIAYQDRIAVAVLTNVGARIAIAQGPY